MSGARTLKNWIERHPAPMPAKRSEVKPVFKAPGIAPAGEQIAQLNLKVPESVKHRYRQMAARDRISMLELFYRMMQAYEDKHGK